MKLERLQLKNFRCFSSLDISFHTELTVIVANNGQGKTAVLDAARIALWPFLHSFDLSIGSAANTDSSIRIDDVLLAFINKEDLVRHLPSSIRAFGAVLGVQTWERSRQKESPSSKTINDVGAKQLESEARNLQVLVRQSSQNQQILPILGYYGTGRLWDQKKRKKESKTKAEIDSSMIRTYGYRDCLDPASSFKMFEDWFIRIYKAHYAELGKILQKVSSLSVRETKYSEAIEVVNDAVNLVLIDTDWLDIYYDPFTESLKMGNKNNSIELEVRQLSDGLRAVIGLVADIAYRCYQLNGHLGTNAARETNGIVLIDEVDMHLHPLWQQQILTQLRMAFPKIQFIVSTHSPQVLTTVPRDNIRIIERVDTWTYQARIPDFSPLAHEAGDALAKVMDTHPQPPLEISEKVHKFEQLVRAGMEDSSDARNLRDNLDEAGYQIHDSDIETWRFLASRKVSKGS